MHEWAADLRKWILVLGGTVNYTPAPVAQHDTIADIFTSELALEMAFKAPSEAAIQVAMQALDDVSRNLFEHLLKASAHRIGWLEQQLRLGQAIGWDEYTSAKITR
jgi:bacterioferritin (cytochrome b1)